jgi:glycosyltransferase involved in cell wall biosynthesis
MEAKPARVLHLLRQMNRAGAETLMMNVFRSLDRDSIQFDFAVYERGDYDEEIESLGGRIIVIPNPMHVGLRTYLKSFRAIFSTYGPYAAVHSHVHHFSGITLHAAYKCKVPVRISHSHTTNDGKHDTFKRRIYRLGMERAIRRYATHRLGCSSQACDALFGNNSVRNARAEVLPNGITMSNFIGSNKHKNELRKELGLPSNRLLLGQIQRFDKEKNHHFTLRVFQSLLKVEPESHLVLVGEGELRSEIESKVDQLGIREQVSFLGTRNDVPELMQAMDILLAPSVYEGLGIVIVEAQAAGLPVVCSEAIPEEADLGLGMVERLSLQLPIEQWVQTVRGNIRTVVPVQNIRHAALVERRYDIQYSTSRLKVLYKSARTTI